MLSDAQRNQVKDYVCKQVFLLDAKNGQLLSIVEACKLVKANMGFGKSADGSYDLPSCGEFADICEEVRRDPSMKISGDNVKLRQSELGT